MKAQKESEGNVAASARAYRQTHTLTYQTGSVIIILELSQDAFLDSMKTQSAHCAHIYEEMCLVTVYRH